jgi:hypothetical protein
METNSESHEMSDEEINQIISLKLKLVFSERLGRKVFVLKDWIDKSLFKRHKKLFGYTDIGWTIKHPKQLVRALVAEGTWVMENESQ